MRNQFPKEKKTRRDLVCYLDATTRHVMSAAAVEEHLPTTSGSEKSAFHIRMDDQIILSKIFPKCLP
jgi:hypothetical protein